MGHKEDFRIASRAMTRKEEVQHDQHTGSINGNIF